MTDTSPLVTILIPTYNRSKYLPQSIRSALAQTYPNIEVLVLDDCSPDDTSKVVEAMGLEDDPRFRYVRHEINKGIAENWRYGFENCKGAFVCILHDDDFFEPDFAETLVKPFLTDSDLIVCFSDHWVVNIDGKVSVSESEKATAQFHRDKLPEGRVSDPATVTLVDISVPIGSTLLRRSLISTDFVSLQAKGSIDVWLLYQCLRTGHGFYYVPKRLMNYRLHDANMSSSQPLYMSEGYLFRQRTVLADTTMKSVHAAVRTQLHETLTGYGIALLRAGKRPEAQAALREAWDDDVRTKRLLIALTLSHAGPFGTTLARRLESGQR